MTIYAQKTDGIANTRDEYLDWLTEEVEELGGAITPQTVRTLAAMLGPREDFDGLPSEVAEASGVAARDLYLSLA